MNGSIHFISCSFWISILIASDLEVCYLLMFRLLMNKLPAAIYKLSREGVLAAELPPKFGTQSNWRGLFPRDILCVDETGVEPNEIDLVMTQNDCQDQRLSRLFKCCKW
ncbi:putative HEN1, double-stranded RNA binding domain 2 [Helianthus anomalus]